MIKGHSLQEDLKHLINNEKYSDVEIKCNDDVTIYGCRAILAARSNVFDKLLYNGMMESSQRIINIGEVNSFGMRVIFEFIYTGTINEESLSKENIVEAFYAADYFEISDLQNEVLRHAKNILERDPHDNYSPELLSKVIDNYSNGEDELINLLIETVSLIPLNTIEFGRLSIDALRCLLSRTHGRPNNKILTNEYEIFRYSAILSAMQVSDEATAYISKRLPMLDDKDDLMTNDEDEIFLPKQEIARELESLARYIDFGLIRGIELTNIIEPLNIVEPKLFFEAYRRKVKLQLCNNNDLNIIRGTPPIRYHFDENDYFWDESTSGSDILIEEQGKVAKINDNDGQHQCVRTSMKLNVETIFEWDIIIEQSCTFAFIGVCTSEGLDFEKFAGEQETAWVLGSSGELFHSGTIIKNYCPPFGDNSIITVHVDMSKTNKNCSFTVNGTRYRAITEWDDLQDFLYPVASICVPAQIRLAPHTLTR